MFDDVVFQKYPLPFCMIQISYFLSLLDLDCSLPFDFIRKIAHQTIITKFVNLPLTEPPFACR